MKRYKVTMMCYVITAAPDSETAKRRVEQWSKLSGEAVAAVELPEGEADGDTSTDSEDGQDDSAPDDLPAEHYQDVLRERLQVRDEERGQR